jgi:hypothetical protein
MQAYSRLIKGPAYPAPPGTLRRTRPVSRTQTSHSGEHFQMTALGYTFLAWAIITAGFVAVMVYKGHLSMHETDQLFLDDNHNLNEEREHDAVVSRDKKLEPIWKAFAGACAVSTLALFGVYVASNI